MVVSCPFWVASEGELRKTKLCTLASSALCTAGSARPAPAQVLWGPGTFTSDGDIQHGEMCHHAGAGNWLWKCWWLWSAWGQSHGMPTCCLLLTGQELGSSSRVEDVLRWRGCGRWKTHLPTQLRRMGLLWETVLVLLAQLLSFDTLLLCFIMRFWIWSFLSHCHMSFACVCVLRTWWVRLGLEKDLMWW